MKFRTTLLILSSLLVAVMCISSVAALEDNIIDDNNLTQDSLDYEESKLCILDDEEELSASQTIIVDEVEENHNEMGSSGTIQKAIDSANAGDTIIINGRSYVHCHFVVDKKLTIKSNVGTTMEVCPSGTSGSGYYGIFYISPQASGTVIEGFTLTSDVVGSDDYAILVSGASNVEIRNCSLSNTGYSDVLRVENAKNVVIDSVSISNGANGIRVKNSHYVTIKNSEIINSNYGIYDVNSTKTTITLNNVSNNKIAGIEIAGTSNYPIISFNNITSNKYGFELTSSDNINILSNYIATNTYYGVYVDCEVTQLNIIGNFFYKNKEGETYFTQKVLVKGGEQFEVINNNYMVGVYERPVDGDAGGGYLGYTFEINELVNCPKIYATYNVLWTKVNYELQLSNITQSKKGVYSISIVDADGNVAVGLSSVPVTFYLNKNNNYVSPQEGDVYKTVMMVNGTATVRFYPEDFIESGNIVTAVLPGTGNYLTSDSGKNVQTFEVNDSFIPGNATQTKISISNLNTYPKSNAAFTVILTDNDSNPIEGETVTFTLNSKKITATTNSNGKATIKISLNAGSYSVKADYAGDDIDYSSSSAQAKITVKKVSTKIAASNYAMRINKADYYKLTLKDSSNNLLASKKVTIKVNKKTYTVKTNKKGVAKLKLKLKKGTYKVVMKYKGTSKYAAAKKTTKITVKKVLKTKLVASKVTTNPKVSTKYTVTLKDENAKVIKKQKVTVKINGKKYTKKTNSKGQVTVSVKLPKVKTYKTSIAFKGSKVYKKSSKSGKIVVQKFATKITVPDMNSYPNTLKDYTVTLKTSAGKVLSKQTLKITINGKSYSKSTNSKGQVTVQTNFSDENTYKVSVSYAGTSIYKSASAAGTVNVSRTQSELLSYNRSFSNDSGEVYTITLRDSSGNALYDQIINYTLNNQSYSQSTDANGQIEVNISDLSVGSYIVSADYAQNNHYRASSSSSTISILNRTSTTFIDEGLPGDEIQAILDSTSNPVEFLATSYDNVSLIINKLLTLTFKENTTLNGKANKAVLTICVSDVNISNLIICANEGTGIIVENASNVNIINNTITDVLNESNMEEYGAGEMLIPGDGIRLSNVTNVCIYNNDVKSFGNAIFAENSDDLEINSNTLSLSNYGINYASDVKNTEITNNLITENIGLYVMDVPEGPLGYGIFLNQSAVNVTITQNNISDNYMGISVDANYSTGIVIQRNLICDNALEGIRFNAGYDLAENAVEPDVNDNAIYRNAKGPSMMILGEMSANPEGIYQYGLYNDSKRLQLGANWFGKNARVTWDYDNNITGYGTMCPRINATYISVNEIEVVSPGTYSITFYKYSEVASNLPVFEMYATLNDDVEVKFNVVEGVGTFSFDASNFTEESNIIKISIGSLTDQYRTFEVILNKTLETSEIPTE